MTHRERILTLLSHQTPDRVPWFGDLDYLYSAAKISGRLPGIVFTPNFGEQDFVAHVKSILQVMRTKPGYVLGVADQVPPDGILERVGSIAALVEEFGRY